MRVDLFDFDLPQDRIALRPAEPRDSARLLVAASDGTLADRIFRDLPSLLRPSDALVFNDTRVIPARLYGERSRAGSSARIEATLHMRLAPDRWLAFLKPAKRVQEGDRIVFAGTNGDTLAARAVEKGEAGEALLQFELAGPALDAAVRAVGHIPLPPYIASRRPDDAEDREDYQTVYAREEGAVAAPTAGLHFTPTMMDSLRDMGVSCHFVTLHVGAGTFLPVKVDDTRDHRMHAEIGTLTAGTAAALNATRHAGGRLVAVGTTSLRLIESAAAEDGTLSPWSGPTDIFITPGYRFRAIDLLLTNFHLPRSTLFMLVAAFAGLERMQSAYRHAIAEGYRFYSYGDASLLERAA